MVKIAGSNPASPIHKNIEGFMKYLCLVLLLLFTPSLASAQTYSACPDPVSAQLTAVYGGITVPVPVTTSEYVYGAVPTTFTELFTYTNITQLRADPKNTKFYGPTNAVSLATKCKAVRLTFNPAEHTGNLCADKHYAGYDITWPLATREKFIEMWVRVDPLFEFNRPRGDTISVDPTCGARVGGWPRGGFVMMMGRVDNLSGAFGVTMGTGFPVATLFDIGAACHFNGSGIVDSTWTKQRDEDQRHACGYGVIPSIHGWKSNDLSLHTLGIPLDGKWHRFRFWFRTGDARRNQGAIGLWIDNQHIATLPNQDATSNTIIGLSLGRFMWHKAPRTQYVEYGSIKVWDTNPGWILCEYVCMTGTGIDIP